MRRILFFTIFLVVFLCSWSGVVAQTRYSESITHFSSDITVNDDRSVRIVETIDYTTTSSKHGIFRYVPYKYDQNGTRKVVRVDGIQVRDGENKGVPFEKSTKGDNVVLKIGDPDRTFTGNKTYKISYTVSDAVEKKGDTPRLLWDITGEGWNFPILKTDVRVHLDDSIKVDKVSCYAGVVGSDDKLCTVVTDTGDTLMFSYPNLIEYGKNLTIDLAFSPTSAFTFPSASELARQRQLRELLSWLPIVPLFVAGFVWYRHGRDVVFIGYDLYNHGSRPTELKSLFVRTPTPIVYEPIDIGPGLSGAVLDERYDTRDLIADILDLARKKYLTITQTQDGGLFRQADFEFKRLKEGGKDLPAHQAKLLESLFSTGSTVGLSSLKGSFYTHYQSVRSLVEKELYSDGLFTTNGKGLRILSILLLIGSYALLFIAMGSLFDYEPMLAVKGIFLGIIGSIGAFIFLWNLSQRSAKGSNYKEQAVGLKATIQSGKWRQEINEKHLFIEEILPFAVAFGVVDRLTRDMKDLSIQPPSYIHASSMNALTTSAFISSFSSVASSSLTYNPSSSSWSGGGSSGGGGGGGGGGSW